MNCLEITHDSYSLNNYGYENCDTGLSPSERQHYQTMQTSKPIIGHNPETFPFISYRVLYLNVVLPPSWTSDNFP